VQSELQELGRQMNALLGLAKAEQGIQYLSPHDMM
jgi:hypothetical protein